MSLPVAQEVASPLSTELRARTSAAHAHAESSPFLAALSAGRVTRPGLAALLVRLVPVYDALEAVADWWAGDPLVGAFVQPELHRASRLRADLLHLTGSVQVTGTPASTAYSARIEQVARCSAPAFVAHHYTRYLGDLSGGQVIRAALVRHLGVDDGSGASFFSFPGIRAGAVKQRYRALLDSTPWSERDREQLVEEALVAYRLNVELAAELDADLPRWTRP
jgi:heme oxygenase